MGTCCSIFSRSQNSHQIARPNDIQKLNESVWQLYHSGGVPAVEVIFFHGLQLSDYREAFWRTWLSRNQELVWPKEWLGPSLTSVRIVSVSYDSSARRSQNAGRIEMYPIIENLVQDIVLDSNYVIHPDSKVILVGHSMGGLIIKELLLNVRRRQGLLDPEKSRDENTINRLKMFLSNCKGILYYSTPHGGSELAAYAARADRVPFANVNMPIIKFLKVLSNETARINNDFSNFRRTSMLTVTTLSIGETKKTKFAGLAKMVVPEASSRIDVDQYYSASADHFEVCKAENSSNSRIFTELRDLCGTWTRIISQAESEQLQ